MGRVDANVQTSTGPVNGGWARCGSSVVSASHTNANATTRFACYFFFFFFFLPNIVSPHPTLCPPASRCCLMALLFSFFFFPLNQQLLVEIYIHLLTRSDPPPCPPSLLSSAASDIQSSRGECVRACVVGLVKTVITTPFNEARNRWREIDGQRERERE